MSGLTVKLPEAFVYAQNWRDSYNSGIMLVHSPKDSLRREKNLISSELALNGAGYLPAISNLSAVYRAYQGLIIVIEGSVRLIFNILYFTGYFSRDVYNRYKLENRISFKSYSREVLLHKRKILNAIRFFSHGMANLGRAMIEFIPIFGNFICLLYDEAGLRLKYNAADTEPTLVTLVKRRNLTPSQSQFNLTSELYQ